MARFISTTLSLLSFLIILLHTNLLAYSQNVLDINGDSLQPNLEYSIEPYPRGVIAISSGPNHTCQDPLDIVLQTDTTIVSPVRFTPVNSKDIFFNEGTDVDIGFSRIGLCTVSTVWKIQTNQTTRYLTTGGAIRNPRNWFQIVSSESGRYAIRYCPTLCTIGRCTPVVFCGNIGLIRDNGRTRLGITSTPLQVSFVPFLSSGVAPTPGL